MLNEMAYPKSFDQSTLKLLPLLGQEYYIVEII